MDRLSRVISKEMESEFDIHEKCKDAKAFLEASQNIKS